MSLLEEFQTQVLPIKDKLYRFSHRIVGDSAEAQDVVQEVFIKMWHKRAEMAQYANVEAWCMRMTKNLSIDKLRSKHRKMVSLDATYNMETSTTTPDKAAEMSDTVNQIHQMMEALPPKQKMVMQLRDIEGMTYQEIADALEINVNQVKVNLFRARKTIREQLLKAESYGL